MWTNLICPYFCKYCDLQMYTWTNLIVHTPIFVNIVNFGCALDKLGQNVITFFFLYFQSCLLDLHRWMDHVNRHILQGNPP